MQQPFVINNRFLADPSINLLKDLQQNTVIHIEPRLMKVLCSLAEQEGKLVSREDFATQVWNDYGGADEGLTQAVSFLRKALDDRSRQLIKTISGKGYIMHATITREATLAQPMPAKKKNRFLRIAGIVSTMLVLGIIYFLFELDLSGDPDDRKKSRTNDKPRQETNNEQLKPSERPTGSMESNSPKNKIPDDNNKKNGVTRTKQDIGTGKKD